MPTTLLAAICSPLPDPPITTHKRAGIGYHSLGSRDAEDGIVVLGVIGVRPVVNHLVTVLGESLDQIVLQLESGVVAADVYAHGSTMADPAAADERSPLRCTSPKRSTRPRDVQRPRLTCRLSELLNAGCQTANDVPAGKRGLHGRGRQATFKIAKHSASCYAGDNLQLVELWIAHDQY